jgi:hypothetical protein
MIRMVEHFDRQRDKMARISAAMKDRPETAHCFSVVMELYFDRPWLRPWNIAPDWPMHTNCEERSAKGAPVEVWFNAPLQ